MVVIFCAQQESLVQQCEERFEGLGLEVDIRMLDTSEEVLAWLCRFPIYSNNALFPSPRLIVTNLETPRGCGLDMIRWLRHHPEFLRIPIIVHGDCSEMEVAKAMKAGATFCLPAGAGSNALCDAIHRLLVR
jgi:CheY-like chemotaxis protein